MDPSVVDYLNSQGKPSDYATRSNLASQYGIANYTGSATQNTQLLSYLRGNSQPLGGTTQATSSAPASAQASKNSPYDTALAAFNDPTSPYNTGYFPDGTPIRNYAQVGLSYGLPYGNGNLGGSRYSPPSDQDVLRGLISNTTPTPQVNLPQSAPGTPGVNGINGVLAYYKSLFDTNSQQAKDYQTQIQNQQKTQGDQTQPFLSKLLGSQTPDQARQAAQAQTGINPTEYFAQEKAQIARIQATTEQYNQAVSARDQQIATTQDKLAPLNFINNQIAQINRNAAPVLNQLSAQINAQAAALQASQGMFSEAKQFINQAVDAATAELKFNFDMYNQFYSQNQSVIDRLDTKYQNALGQARSYAEKAFTYVQDEKTKVGQLLLANPQAGINIGTDTFEQALQKVQANPKTTGTTVGSEATGYTNVIRDNQGNVVKTQPIGATGTVAGAVKLSPTQLNSGSSMLGVTPAQFKALDPQVQTFFTGQGGSKFMTAITDIKNGKSTYQDVKDSIAGSLQPQQVKDYLQQTLDRAVPQNQTGGRGFWNKLGSWFSGSGFK